MSVLSQIIDRTVAAPKHIVLAEGTDERVVAGAVNAARHGLARITLLGPLNDVWALTQKAGDIDQLVDIIDPETSKHLQDYSKAYYDLRKHKGISEVEAQRAARNPLNYANLMVQSEAANGSVSGAVHTTPDVVRSALQIIGIGQDHDMVSSLFIMIMPEHAKHLKGGVIYSDCGLVVDPDAKQLAGIAAAATDNAVTLLGLVPKVAMLSFSTRGSANHPMVDKVEKAAAILKDKRPDLAVEGGIQFDAAIIDAIADRKAPNSDVAGQANVFIFPDLNAGNIAYKITERLGGATAIGPILQGLARPANDLSRGCTSEDVYNMIAVTVVQAQAAAGEL